MRRWPFPALLLAVTWPELGCAAAAAVSAVGELACLDCRGECVAGSCLSSSEGFDRSVAGRQPPARIVAATALADLPSELPPPAFPPGGPHADEVVLSHSGRHPLVLRLPKEAFFGGASAGEASWRRRFSGYGAAALPSISTGEGDLDAGPVEAASAHYRLIQTGRGSINGAPQGVQDQLPPQADLPLSAASASTPVQPMQMRAEAAALRAEAAQLQAQPPQDIVSAQLRAEPPLNIEPPPGLHRYMQAQLEQEQTEEAELSAENKRLRAELARWRQAGSKVAEREARVVELIHRTAADAAPPRPPTAAPESQTDEVSLMEESVETYVFNAGKQPLTDGTNAMRMLVIFLSMNALAFLLWLSAGQMKGGGFADKLIQPMLRSAGMGYYSVEVSEIQVRNMPVSEDAYVSFQVGSDKEIRTQSAEPTEVGILCFEEVLTLRVLSGGRAGTCSFTVVDRDPLGEERAARHEMPAWELLRLVKRGHGEYFDFDLEPLQRKHRPAGTAFAAPKGRRPCLAMRLRDATNPKAVKGGPPAEQMRSKGCSRRQAAEASAATARFVENFAGSP